MATEQIVQLHVVAPIVLACFHASTPGICLKQKRVSADEAPFPVLYGCSGYCDGYCDKPPAGHLPALVVFFCLFCSPLCLPIWPPKRAIRHIYFMLSLGTLDCRFPGARPSDAVTARQLQRSHHGSIAASSVFVLWDAISPASWFRTECYSA